MSGETEQSKTDLIVAHQLLGLAYKNAPASGVVDYLLMNIRWMSTALFIALGNDRKAAAKYLRTLAEGLDPVSPDEADTLLDRTLGKK
jgi:hypothetical protein